MKSDNHLEPIVILLFVGMMFFTGMVFVCEHFFHDDGQVFQVIAGILSAFSGAFFMRIKQNQDTPPPSNTTVKVDSKGSPAIDTLNIGGTEETK